MNYELTNDTINHLGVTLHRIRALQSFSNVTKGDLGGYVQSTSNLSQYNNAWVYGDARVYGDAEVFGTARVFGNAIVSGNAKVYGNTTLRNYDEISNTNQYINIIGFKYTITVTYSSVNIGCMSFTLDQLDDDIKHVDFSDDDVDNIKQLVTYLLGIILDNISKELV